MDNSNSNQQQSLPTLHGDIVHDISFNYFGTRMATASSDKTVKNPPISPKKSLKIP